MPEIAPLDAYETAKPNEPIFTLQGGDPLAPSLVRLWALLARTRAEVLKPSIEWITPALVAANQSSLAHDPKEIEELLLRATLAEEVSWNMDNYLKGQVIEEQDDAKHFDEFERLDIWDIRRRFASTISGFTGNLTEYKKELSKRNFMDKELLDLIDGAIEVADILKKEIEV
jgi:hypothetical protein